MKDDYKKALRLVVIVAAVYLGFRYLLPLFLPFLLAYFIAVLLRKPVRFLKQNLHIRPAIGGSILLILFLMVAGGGIIYAVKVLLQQFISLVANYESYAMEWNGYLEEACGYCDAMLRFERGRTFSILSNGLDGIVLFFQNELIPFLTKHSLKAALSVTELGAAIVLIFVSVLLFLTDMTAETKQQNISIWSERVRKNSAKRAKERIQTCSRQAEKTKGKRNLWNVDNTKQQESQKTPVLGFLEREWREVRQELSGAGIAYVKTQAILILLVSITCSVGLALIRNPYALLFGVGIGFFDAFPILGSGLILVPWAVISFFRGNVFVGAVLLTLYGICQFIREYLEPKLLGGKMGIRPIQSLMAVYVGYELFGLLGLFLGPFGLVLIKSLWRVSKEE